MATNSAATDTNMPDAATEDADATFAQFEQELIAAGESF